ncbi:NAD(+) synthase [Haliangium ochraceum]|uniref:Glutamine-dependent NAD(+) synthetase n=1 Tax=Haliangium ochraceum (strain DSM 14365 / JCM 11303 / SMP-2) TaxID=502025 RepID=D0LX93_HALO1|nr:NAD(+) synthase [Haliangium ochraceum]ACY16135.1 NAD+ synthetase [Haliangium ochraceum DSM 14365]
MSHFHSIYRHGFVRAAVAVPEVRVADPAFNAARTCELARRASQQHAAVLLFPELGLSAYSNEDLFHQDALLDGVLAALQTVLEASETLSPLLLLGAPLRFRGALFNCCVAVYHGRILGVTPKSYLPNYREFYEKRQFTAARCALLEEVTLLGQTVPFGNDIVYEADSLPGFAVHAEICEDVWTPIPPSTYAALAGATVLANLSASNITIGKADYRRDLCAAHSGRCVAAYLYSAAGPGESTTDLAWDGQALIYENDLLLAEAERFHPSEQLIFADVDIERLLQERMRLTSFQDTIADHGERVRAVRRVRFAFQVPQDAQPEDRAPTLRRALDRFPFVPSDDAARDERCYEAYNIQVHGLLQRLASTGIDKLVIGVSGGLDSTHALIVAAKTMDRLDLPRENILAYTMPGFATSERTLRNAHALMSALGATAREIDIRPSCRQMLADLDHPFARGEEVYDVTFENVQAGERSSHLFRLANHNGGLVLGTGDLSELALGWCTYGVGDQMSHYNVNASVPKTLIQHLVRWVADNGVLNPAASEVLRDILATEISPELVPASSAADEDGSGDGQGGDARQSAPAQRTEDIIGPYELQDFHIYYLTRYGFRPSKVAFLAHCAWGELERGDWPGGFAEEDRRAYERATIKKWLRVLLHRFFQVSQFKRSAMPNGPKVGSGGSLSPRGDWRAPSDSRAAVWLDELDHNVPD